MIFGIDCRRWLSTVSHRFPSFLIISTVMIVDGPQPGGVFDPNSYVMWLVPTLLHSVRITRASADFRRTCNFGVLVRDHVRYKLETNHLLEIDIHYDAGFSMVYVSVFSSIVAFFASNLVFCGSLWFKPVTNTWRVSDSTKWDCKKTNPSSFKVSTPWTCSWGLQPNHFSTSWTTWLFLVGTGR